MLIHKIRSVPGAVATSCAVAVIVLVGVGGATVQAASTHGVHVTAHSQISADGNPWGRPSLVQGLA